MDPGLHVTPGIGISVLPTVLKTSDTCCWRFWSHTALLYYLENPAEVVSGGVFILTCPSVFTSDIMLRVHYIHVNRGRNQV